jgi:mannose-1-phosphate guanylyltransferase
MKHCFALIFLYSFFLSVSAAATDQMPKSIDSPVPLLNSCQKMKHIVICGGVGSRLWPLSRQEYPKQFLKLFRPYSLFQKTVLNNLPISKGLIISCHTDHYHLAQRELEEINIVAESYLLESISRNTAPAIALALHLVEPEEVVLITPSDHWIEPQEEYIKTVNQAKLLADQGHLVIFGIHPTFPATGYGYIESVNGNALRFHEKPSLELAESYLKTGAFDWNSGMVCGKAKTILEALEKCSPKIACQADKAMKNNKSTPPNLETRVVTILPADMQDFSDESFDIAVLEKYPYLKVVKAMFQWSDIGSFDSLLLCQEKNGKGILAKEEEIFLVNAHHNHVIAEKKVVGIVGLDNIGIIDANDALLVYKQGNSEQVKNLVQLMKSRGHITQRSNLEEHCPWGILSVLTEEPNYKVKKIKIYPKKQLSLQLHPHRNEHWVVVEGSAIVRIGDIVKHLQANDQIYIPKETLHSVENPGDIDLVFILTQYGNLQASAAHLADTP